MKTAALQAMEKLKTYYQKTDAVVFTVVTIIDPRLKLSYHEKNKWEKVFIDSARDQFKALFKHQYYHPELAAEVDEEGEEEEDLMAHIYMQHKPNPEQDELRLYLAASPADANINVLQWWKVNNFTFTLLFNLNLF